MANRPKISTKWQLELDAMPITPELAKERHCLREQILKMKKLELAQKKTNHSKNIPKKQENKIIQNPGLPKDWLERTK